MPIRQHLNSERVPVHIFTEDVDAASLEQLKRVAALPVVGPSVAAMPDVHLGKGATVGSVIPSREAIIPAAVGVDIGCGMMARRLDLTADQLPESLKAVRRAIERVVPVGFDSHDAAHAPYSACEPLARGLDRILERHPTIARMGKNMRGKFTRQMGTLGGGNHFVELCLDESERVWVMLHSGSRGIGNAIGRYFIEYAREDMRIHQRNLPDKDLSYLREGTTGFDDYVEAVGWAQDYARHNRETMMAAILEALQGVLPPFRVTEEAIKCHHNYVARESHGGSEVWVTRKGAIRARRGDLGIIPGSMGACSYIVRGRGGPPEALDSCAHGAGRRMSRRQAKKQIDLNQLRATTRGVECRKDRSVLDEAPGAYKDIDRVMANQTDLVDVLHRLKQVVCVKG
ncbi:tRNA-splicing ligase RtcB [Natronospira proteinivora]|uniref:3'-phosphate/5'-hydroxy nucleic acid ligase n=1 Tax=Natronospira proteinivora TaxID=1807133 RepID=A0ABT1G660_9GAMM|nr:RtcB family protein [Natronospira proteinivora]MCP1726786.1 tRNA-splicing ligase RtcB [Natronospira proteinivora]